MINIKEYVREELSKYDGKYICLEADVQSIQTHNPNKAIRGEWGVTNVSAADGSLTVGE